MAVPSREQFPAVVIGLVRSKFPLVKIGLADGFALSVNGHSASLENIYRMSVLRPDDTQQHVNRWIVELIRAAEGNLDHEGTFEELKDRILPLVLGGDTAMAREGAIICQPLIEGLVVAYAVDSDRTISYVSPDHFESWELPLDDLHETAMANLVARSDSMNAHAAQDEDGNINLILFQTMDGYDASRILLPTLHDRLREHLGSPFAAAVPNRDILLCFRNDDATVARLRGQIADDFQSMPHQVTDKLFLITPDGIAPMGDERQ
jgi:uncharacterized protein YtpQ (UPF0354 family)